MSIDYQKLDDIIKAHGKNKASTIPILQDVQRHFRYVPFQALEYIAKKTDISATNLYGVATFYTQFRLSPVGKHIIKVCHGTACHVSGATGISEAMSENLDVPIGGTTDDGLYTLESVACLGCCSLAPVMMIDDMTYGRLTRTKAAKITSEHSKECLCHEDTEINIAWEKETKTKIKEIKVGLGSCGIASGADKVLKIFQAAAKKYKIPVNINITGCMGMCHKEPIIDLLDSDGNTFIYVEIDKNKAIKIIEEHVAKNIPLKEWIINRSDTSSEEGEFFTKQRQIVLENCGKINPEAIDEYINAHGYQALEKSVKELTPEIIIDEITLSGLRGRGGAGFPTGIKWKYAREAKGNKKYIICNADEGDPGAFMDRSVLESDPHRVLEGMAIAGCAIGSDEAYIYCRAEYPLAIKRLKKAIKDAEAKNLLGNNIMGTEFSFNIHIKEGAGAFVCGEETALIASIEGKRGMPKIRPPFPAQSGLWKCPTNINNVETLANIAWIIRHGAKKYASSGTEKSKGTKVFALAGKIKRGGLVEVPMGITLNQVINNIGGGTSSGKKVKAVQLGGPSGGCIPADLMDTPVDYDAVNSTGAIMGSGGMVVMDEDTCMVDVARFFLDFTQNESCGKCTFCRIGTKRMLEILTRICEGNGTEKDIYLLEDLADKIKNTSLCGLGQTAPNPVLTTLKYFRHEYEAHIKDKKCPSHVCKNLISFEVITEKCIGCGACKRVCPVNAITGTKKKPHVIDKTICTKCGACFEACKFEAIKK